jgi:hypothetical protein
LKVSASSDRTSECATYHQKPFSEKVSGPPQKNQNPPERTKTQQKSSEVPGPLRPQNPPDGTRTHQKQSEALSEKASYVSETTRTTRTPQKPPEAARTRQNPPALTETQQNPAEPTRTHQNTPKPPPERTSTVHYSPKRTKTYKNPPEPRIRENLPGPTKTNSKTVSEKGFQHKMLTKAFTWPSMKKFSGQDTNQKPLESTRMHQKPPECARTHQKTPKPPPERTSTHHY